MSESPLVGLIDARCGCPQCVSRTENVYRMVSHRCSNCRGGPWLVLYRVGDRATAQHCPICGGTSTVSADRLATADEIPAAVPR